VAATCTLRERVLLMATYGGGLRVSEVVALRPGDLDAERGVIRVEQGKGKQDRYTVLAERLVREVGQYYRVYGHPQHWVFPQRAARYVMNTARSRPAPRSPVSTATAPPRSGAFCAHLAGPTLCAPPVAAQLRPPVFPPDSARRTSPRPTQSFLAHPVRLLPEPQTP